MQDTFSKYHPFVNFIFFVSVIGITMFAMHPVILSITIFCSAVYSIYLNRKSALKFQVLYMLPFMLLMALINPLFNHAGVTILLYINDNPITLESIVYGIASSVMFISVILWFSCYNCVMTSDKFIFLFGKIIPSLSLIFSMVLRFVPKYKAQIKVISNAQKCTGRDVSNGNLIERAKNGVKILSVMTTWALENAIETADSMKSRGYGLKGRTAYSLYKFALRDKLATVVIALLDITVLAGFLTKQCYVSYMPSITFNGITPYSMIVYICFAGLCLLPLIVNVMEDIVWHSLKSKI